MAKTDIDAHLARERIDQADLQENAISLYHLTQPERLDVLEARALLEMPLLSGRDGMTENARKNRM